MYRIAICDNEPQELAHIAAGVDRWAAAHPGAGVVVSSFSSADALAQVCADNVPFDLFVLDILMPGTNGIELGRWLRRAGSDAGIIYITSSPDYALDAYAVAALRYLPKPVEHEALFSALDFAWTVCTAKLPPMVILQNKGGVRQVPLKDIIYIENSVRDMLFHLQDGSSILCTHRDLSFEEAVERMVGGGRSFLQTHKSYFVNMAYIQQINAAGVRLDNGTLIPVTRRRLTDIRSAYLDYISDEATCR